MALSEARKNEIIEEEKLRLQARREAWKEFAAEDGWHGRGCHGGRRFWLGKLLFWGLAIGLVAHFTLGAACGHNF